MYTPVFVNITDGDFISYQNYTKQVIVALNQDPVDEALVKDILTKRSSVIKKSNAKLEKLEEMVGSQSGKKYNFKNSVVYCGHGKDFSRPLFFCFYFTSAQAGCKQKLPPIKQGHHKMFTFCPKTGKISFIFRPQKSKSSYHKSISRLTKWEFRCYNTSMLG
jgi:hypothetical protein